MEPAFDSTDWSRAQFTALVSWLRDQVRGGLTEAGGRAVQVRTMKEVLAPPTLAAPVRQNLLKNNTLEVYIRRHEYEPVPRTRGLSRKAERSASTDSATRALGRTLTRAGEYSEAGRVEGGS